MKSEELLYSLDYVGEDLLGAAEQTVLARKKRPWLRTAVAAVLVLAIGAGGFLLLKHGMATSQPVPGAETDSESPPVSETQPVGVPLPMLTVGDSWKDRGAWTYDDPKTSLKVNQWTLETGVERLTVYACEGAAAAPEGLLRYDEAQILLRQAEAKELLGAKTISAPVSESTDYNGGRFVTVTQETDLGTLTADSSGRVRILFNEDHVIASRVEVKLDFAAGTTEAQMAAAYRDFYMADCGKQVEALLGLPECQAPVCEDWSSVSSAFRVYLLYPVREAPAEQLKSRFFEAVSLLTIDGRHVEGLEWTQLPAAGSVCQDPEQFAALDAYPILSVQMAKQAAMAGQYYSSRGLNRTLTEADLSLGELVYLPAAEHSLLLPFYRFWVPEPRIADQEAFLDCVSVLVPAVEPAYLTDFPTAKEDPAEAEDARIRGLLTSQTVWHCATGRTSREFRFTDDGSFAFSLHNDGWDYAQEGSWEVENAVLRLRCASGSTAEYAVELCTRECLTLTVQSRQGVDFTQAGEQFTYRPLPVFDVELPSEISPDSSTSPADPALTAEIEALFAEEQSWYCRALTSEYAGPEDADLGLLFYAGLPKADNHLSEAEYAALEGRVSQAALEDTSCDRLPAAEVDRVLTQLFGLDRAALAAARQADPAALLGADHIYLSEFDCYYHFHGDTNLLPVNVQSVEQVRDCVLVYYCTAESLARQDPADQWIVCLRKEDGDWRIVYNLPVSRFLTEDEPLSPETDPTEPEPNGDEPEAAAEPDFNGFLTCFLQQGIPALEPETAEESELVSFVHIYAKLHQREALTYRTEGDEVWETMSLVDANRILRELTGRSLSPAEGTNFMLIASANSSQGSSPTEETDYTALQGYNYTQQASYHDGLFWWPAADGELYLSFAVCTFAGQRTDDDGQAVWEGSFQVYTVDPDVLPEPDWDALLKLNEYEVEMGLVETGVVTRCVEGDFLARSLEDGGLQLIRYAVRDEVAFARGSDAQPNPHGMPDGDTSDYRYSLFAPDFAEALVGQAVPLRVGLPPISTEVTGLTEGQALKVWTAAAVTKRADGTETTWYLVCTEEKELGWVPAETLTPPAQ